MIQPTRRVTGWVDDASTVPWSIAWRTPSPRSSAAAVFWTTPRDNPAEPARLQACREKVSRIPFPFPTPAMFGRVRSGRFALGFPSASMSAP